jgi:hypothetical protein
MSNFWPLWVVYGPFGMFWADMDHLQALQSCFEVFQIILGSFWPIIVSGSFRAVFGPFQAISGCIKSLNTV